MTSFLYCFSIVIGNLFTFAFKTDKSDNYRYRDSWKSDNFKERKQTQRHDTKKEAKTLRVITLQGAIEKSTILLSQNLKIHNLIAP